MTTPSLAETLFNATLDDGDMCLCGKCRAKLESGKVLFEGCADGELRLEDVREWEELGSESGDECFNCEAW